MPPLESLLSPGLQYGLEHSKPDLLDHLRHPGAAVHHELGGDPEQALAALPCASRKPVLRCVSSARAITRWSCFKSASTTSARPFITSTMPPAARSPGTCWARTSRAKPLPRRLQGAGRITPSQMSAVQNAMERSVAEAALRLEARMSLGGHGAERRAAAGPAGHGLGHAGCLQHHDSPPSAPTSPRWHRASPPRSSPRCWACWWRCRAWSATTPS
jgi:hypothetical protein